MILEMAKKSPYIIFYFFHIIRVSLAKIRLSEDNTKENCRKNYALSITNYALFSYLCPHIL